MSGPILAKKGEPTLLAAVRRFRDNGGTWADLVQLIAPEFGACFENGGILGWVPVVRKRKR